MNANTNKKFFGERLLNRLVYPRKVEDYVQMFNPIWSSGKILGQVIQVRKETTDCTSIILKVNDNWTGCDAGQYAMITVEIDGKKYSRMFTISESGRDSVTFTVKRNGDGLVSNWINDAAKLDDIIEISAPQGDFTLLEIKQKPVIMVAGGSGITPFWAMLQDMRDLASSREVALLYYSPKKDDTILLKPLQDLAASLRNVELTVVHTRDKAAIDGKHYFGAQAIESLSVNPQDAEIFVCGPSSLIGDVETYCNDNGLADAFHKEYFTPPVIEVAAEDLSITFSQSDIVLQNGDGTLLENAERAGLTPEHGCRMGICQTCTCKKVSGRVKNIVTGDVLDEDVSTIQLCITAACDSDVVLEL